MSGCGSRKKVGCRRSPMQHPGLRPSLSLPLPAAIYEAKVAEPPWAVSAHAVVPVRVDPVLLRLCEYGKGAYGLDSSSTPMKVDVSEADNCRSVVVNCQVCCCLVRVRMPPSACLTDACCV